MDARLRAAGDPARDPRRQRGALAGDGLTLSGDGLTLSVVVPARDEAGSIAATLDGVRAALDAAGAPFEVVVVDDGSRDATAAAVEAAARLDGRVRLVRRGPPHGFGHAVRAGLDAARGDAAAIVMADACDDPADLVRYHRLLASGWDCVFGSRFAGGPRVSGYPRGKLVLNRLANGAIRCVFRHGLDDTTNAFKAYRREVLEDLRPLRSGGFELTAELPLRAVARGHSYTVVAVSWRGRTAGRSKFSLAQARGYASAVVRAARERREPRAP